MTARYVIVNADDFGLSESVNRGVCDAHRAGVVTSATVMANMPGFLDAVRRARAMPGLGVGLHVNFTYGRPLTPPELVPTLVGYDGAFFYRDLEARAVGAWSAEEVARELAAQWNRARRAGLRLTHLDSHHHVQRHPVVYAAMARLAASEELPMRRTADEFPADLPFPHPPTTDRLISDVYFMGDGRERFLARIRSIGPGVTEIMTHPGYVDDDVRLHSAWTDQRAEEARVLADPSLAAAMSAQGLRRIHFGQLAAARREGAAAGGTGGGVAGGQH
ncbi:MAG: carbohydrate deacetylase [Firmicutes bacterium]|nr:carbohydrate deacetylase [Bacillota bacterium]